MNIKLSLKNHCIETEIKKQYNRSVSQYFSSRETGEKKNLETRIALLHHALETLDFGYLRNRYADLHGQSMADVELGADPSDNLHLAINGKAIDAKNQI